jgi:uncharacterized protein (DUF433 family)
LPIGKPVIRGTRVQVELILRKLSEGATRNEILDGYPQLTREDTQASIRYANEIRAAACCPQSSPFRQL